MKKALIITYYWPPAGGSGVQRWVKFTKYLPDYGWTPVIYTPENPEMIAKDESLLSDIPEGVEVVMRRIVEPYAIYRALTGGKKKSGGEVNPINSGKKSFTKKAALFIRSNFFVPDPRVTWVAGSVRFLEKYIKEHPVDAVITTGPPHSVHLIGLGLKRRTGVRWIADFRDPWTGMFYFKNLNLLPFARRRQFSLEQQVLDEADTVISVTPLVKADFEAKTLTPVELVTNGFDEDDFPPTAAAADRNMFTITHTGLFASDGNPLTLWKALADLCREDLEFSGKLKIRLIGKTDSQIIDSIVGAGLSTKLENLGYLSHTETVKEQRQAAVLILPLRNDPEYRKVYPGKIFEYIASRRPVLGIGTSDAVSATLLEESGAGSMFDWSDEKGIRNFIEKSWRLFRSGEDFRNTCDISRYTRKALTEELVRILK